jgi:hypothetical protein
MTVIGFLLFQVFHPRLQKVDGHQRLLHLSQRMKK